MNRTLRVTAPATSANLGPGFDAFGLALGLYDVVRVEAHAPGRDPALRIAVEGEGENDLPRDGSHLVARAMRATFEALGEPVPGLLLRCSNTIAHGRGLGSSAAAIATGVLAARGLVEAGRERLDDAATLRLAARLEGHPDNVAACILGGLTVAWTSGDDVTATRLEVHRDVRPVACVPPAGLSTQTARGLLPEAVPHPDAAANAARAALLVEALARRPELLLDATEDRLHQPYRAPAMPETMALVADLRSRGLPAVVSGAGPAVLVLATGQPGPITVPAGWVVRPLVVDRNGAVVETV